jgi:hypothetical protein
VDIAGLFEEIPNAASVTVFNPDRLLHLDRPLLLQHRAAGSARRFASL